VANSWCGRVTGNVGDVRKSVGEPARAKVNQSERAFVRMAKVEKMGCGWEAVGAGKIRIAKRRGIQ